MEQGDDEDGDIGEDSHGAPWQQTKNGLSQVAVATAHG
jgi:hypothetical protein